MLDRLLRCVAEQFPIDGKKGIVVHRLVFGIDQRVAARQTRCLVALAQHQYLRGRPFAGGSGRRKFALLVGASIQQQHTQEEKQACRNSMEEG